MSAALAAGDRAAAEAATLVLAAQLIAVDPAGLGGVRLRCRPGHARDRWLAQLRAALPTTAPWRRMPAGITTGRLLGGLDLAATLRTGRPVAERGLLAEADGGIVLVPMAERLTAEVAAHIAAALDQGEVVLEREGLAQRLPAHLGFVLLDEGCGDDESVAAKLVDRLAFSIDLDVLAPTPAVLDDPSEAIQAARARLACVVVDDGIVESLNGAAFALGVVSLRAVIFAVRVARAMAALAGRDAATAEDAAVAAGLVLAPRATRLPADPAPPEAAEDAASPPPPPAEEGEARASGRGRGEDGASVGENDDIVLAAAAAAIPAGLLAQLRSGVALRRDQASGGKAGQLQASTRRGRPAGVRAGLPKEGARLDIVETLRAAAPWQRLRAAAGSAPRTAKAARILVRAEDFRIVRNKRRAETTTLFIVDASGSSALNRLAEAKGAVELLLAECYVRRDQVALMAFRGRGADLVLPPTRSLARAKRCLAGLPGGGGTPLAAALQAAVTLADAIRRKGQTPTLVLMTDGRANVSLDGRGGRAAAEEDAVTAARQVRAAAYGVLFVDTAPRSHPFARHLADTMAAKYLALPRTDAAALSRAVRSVALQPG